MKAGSLCASAILSLWSPQPIQMAHAVSIANGLNLMPQKWHKY
jgi:hypothetical protein